METISGLSNWKLTLRREVDHIQILRAVTFDRRAALPDELFGLPDNEITDASTMEAEMPTPRAYVMDYREQKESDYSWAVVCIQQRLYELNYLNSGAKSAVEGSVADGVYGECCPWE